MPKLKPNQFLIGNHLITERPILFQTEMVKANMEDRKTMTRREKGLELLNDDLEYQKSITLMKMDYDIDGDRCLRIFRHGDVSNSTVFKSPYGKPGDLLWVRETWGHPALGDDDSSARIIYKADWDWPDLAKKSLASDKWKPSIHLPKTASRIWAMVEDVRPERLQDISEADAIAEGCSLYGPFGEFRGSLHPNGGSMRYRAYSKASRAFQCIWEEINGTASWNANPWVWVIQYRILSKTGRPDENTILDNYLQITGKGVALV